MSTPTPASNGLRPAGRAAGAARPAGKAVRQRHTPGGVGLGTGASPEAQRLAAAILEVLAGVRTPAQAAQAVGISLPRYFQIETRAMEALVASCAPRPRGPGRSVEKELASLKRHQERLQRELSRHQTLVRLAQRTVGLAPPPASAPPSGGKEKGKKRRRPVVRALRAAEALRQRSQETPGPEGAPAAVAAEKAPEG